MNHVGLRKVKNMSVREALITTIVAVFAGAVVSLIIRIMREGVSKKKPLRALSLSFCYLILYPYILFPLFAIKYKKEIAVIIANKIVEESDKSLNKSKKQIERDVLCNLTTINIIKMWGNLVKNITLNYDRYVDENIGFVKKDLATEKKQNCRIRTFSNSKLRKNVFKNIGDENLERLCINC